jgi:hypothetical protein
MSPHIYSHVSSLHAAVSKSPYRYGRIHYDHISFFDKQLPCFVAQLLDLRLGYGSTLSQIRYSPALPSALRRRLDTCKLCTCPNHSSRPTALQSLRSLRWRDGCRAKRLEVARASVSEIYSTRGPRAKIIEGAKEMRKSFSYLRCAHRP